MVKDTSGSTAADDDTYNLIMRDKEKLLGFESPLKFIFSHSALKEGWDNPNVFQICNFSDTRDRALAPADHRPRAAPVREPGRRATAWLRGEHTDRDRQRELPAVRRKPAEGDRAGYRHSVRRGAGPLVRGVPVRRPDGTSDATGLRCSRRHCRSTCGRQGYIDAKGKVQDALQDGHQGRHAGAAAEIGGAAAQIRQCCARLAGKLEIKNADDRRQVPVRRAVLDSPEFKALWDRIKYKTTYRVQFDNERLIRDCIAAVSQAPPISKTRLQWRKAGHGDRRGRRDGGGDARAPNGCAQRGRH